MPKPPENFSIDDLRRVFRYEPASGELFWRIRPSRNVRAGAMITSRDKNGYLQVRFRSRVHRGHHIVWAIIYGEWPTEQIDHWDRDPGNNREKNLRPVSQHEQALNREFPNKTGFKGVKASTNGTFGADTRMGSALKRIGTFPSALKAALAYDAVAIIIPGMLTNKQLGRL
jgi:hypothetical protein